MVRTSKLGEEWPENVLLTNEKEAIGWAVGIDLTVNNGLVADPAARPSSKFVIQK